MFPSTIDLLNIFVQYPGNFLFFLLIIGLTQVSLFIALDRRGTLSGTQPTGRYTTALGSTLFAWLMLLAAAVFAVAVNQSPNALLPPLEHAVMTLTVVFVGWGFYSADHESLRRFRNVAALLITFLIILGYMYTGITWAQLADETDFYFSLFGLFWSLAALLVSLIGLILTILFVRHVVDAPLKMIFFLICIAGFGFTAYSATTLSVIGNASGVNRLAMLIAFAIVPIVVYRNRINTLVSTVSELQTARPSDQDVEKPEKIVPQPRPVERVPAPPDTQSVQLLKALGHVLEAESPEKIPERIVNTAIDMLHADVGALLQVQDANYADIVYGHDKVMKRSPRGMSLNLDDQPTLVNVIERRLQRALFYDRNADELIDLFTRLDVEQTGPVYLQPLVRRQEVIAVLAVAYPYAQRELAQAELELLKAFGIIASNLLNLSFETKESIDVARERAIQAIVEGVPPSEIVIGDISSARQEMQESLRVAREQITELSKQVMNLKLELDDERTRVANLLGDSEEELTISQRIVAITEEQDTLRRERDQLARRLQEAETALNGATAIDDDAMVNNMVESLKREQENLSRERDRLQGELEQLRQQNVTPLSDDVQALVDRMMAEQSQLTQERDQLSDKLTSIQHQLQELGYSTDEAGLSQILSQLFEERSQLKRQLETALRDRDMLLTERQNIESAIRSETERSERIQLLEAQIQKLANDREAAIKQRDRLRADRDELNEKLNKVKEHRARLLAQTSGFEIELTEAHEEQMRLRAQVQDLSDDRTALTDYRDRLLAENEMLRSERDQLRATAEGDDVRAGQITEQGMSALRQMINELSDERTRLERELSDTQTKLHTIESQLEQANTANYGKDSLYQPNEPDLIVGLVQELRTPMTSVSGYVDLLLSESSGILGEMQRKFLQRVSANIQRLSSMIDDLVHVTELDTGKYQLEAHPVNIVEVIEDAITNASIQFREKGLSVQLSLEDDLPPVEADLDAVHQIIGQLLTNAYLASPSESSIQIIAKQQVHDSDDEQQTVVFVSVRDSGGGVPTEDIPRVFARKYKAENPLIAGLGDTGVGMSIAKALVDAHGGQLWVETSPGTGSAFNFVLPLAQKTAGEA